MAPVELLVSLWDRDHGEGAKAYKTALDKTLGITATGAAAAGGPIGTIIGGVAAVAKAIDVPGIVASIASLSDPDDFLGQKTFEQTAKGLPSGHKDHFLKFNRSGARYTVRLRTEVS